jgi:hypothetical protein
LFDELIAADMNSMVMPSTFIYMAVFSIEQLLSPTPYPSSIAVDAFIEESLLWECPSMAAFGVEADGNTEASRLRSKRSMRSTTSFHWKHLQPAFPIVHESLG